MKPFVKVQSDASNIKRYPAIVDFPRRIFIASIACKHPITPGTGPRTPFWEHEPIVSGGGGVGKIHR